MTVPTTATSEANVSTTIGKLEDLRNRLIETLTPGGEAAVTSVHEAGRLTARERVNALLDPDSFVEIDALARHRATSFNLDRSHPVTDGVVTGYGTVDGRQVCIFSQDATIFDGTVGETHGEKLIKVMELAERAGVPLIGIHDSTGARVKEGVVSLGIAAKLYRLRSRLSGVVPQISVIAGPTAGTEAHQPVLADVVIAVEGSHLFLTDPAITQAVLGEEVTADHLGGTEVLATNGTSHLTAADDTAALALVHDVLNLLPSNNRSLVADTARAVDPEANAVTALDTVIPDSPLAGYDIFDVLSGIVDPESILELSAQHAGNVLTALARVEGRGVGVVASQPLVLAGALDAAAAAKAARFVRMCDAFNIPLIFVVDSPGFMPGSEEERQGLLRRSAPLFSAVAEASVGILTVVVRKAFGSAYIAMGSKNIGADMVLAWPTAQISHADAANTVNAVHADTLAKAARKRKDVDALRAQLTEDIEDSLITPYAAASRGFVDAVIAPSETRSKISDGLALLERKVVAAPVRKHNNLPL